MGITLTSGIRSESTPVQVEFRSINKNIKFDNSAPVLKPDHKDLVVPWVHIVEQSSQRKKKVRMTIDPLYQSFAELRA